MADRSIREQRALLKATTPPLPPLVRRMAPHEVLGELEQSFVCQGPCGMKVLVGPCWEDIDAETFVCGDCLTAAGEVETVDLEASPASTGRDGTLIDRAAGRTASGTAGNGSGVAA